MQDTNALFWAMVSLYVLLSECDSELSRSERIQREEMVAMSVREREGKRERERESPFLLTAPGNTISQHWDQMLMLMLC
jgi:hypothetical protein